MSTQDRDLRRIETMNLQVAVLEFECVVGKLNGVLFTHYSLAASVGVGHVFDCSQVLPGLISSHTQTLIISIIS